MEGELTVGGRPADVACLQPIKADPLPSVTHHPRRFLRGLYPPPLPPSQQLSMACDAICLYAPAPPLSAQLLDGHAHEVPRGLI
jgi:hypothetical protein